MRRLADPSSKICLTAGHCPEEPCRSPARATAIRAEAGMLLRPAYDLMLLFFSGAVQLETGSIVLDLAVLRYKHNCKHLTQSANAAASIKSSSCTRYCCPILRSTFWRSASLNARPC